jgi:hypothetical protein
MQASHISACTTQTTLDLFALMGLIFCFIHSPAFFKFCVGGGSVKETILKKTRVGEVLMSHKEVFLNPSEICFPVAHRDTIIVLLF